MVIHCCYWHPPFPHQVLSTHFFSTDGTAWHFLPEASAPRGDLAPAIASKKNAYTLVTPIASKRNAYALVTPLASNTMPVVALIASKTMPLVTRKPSKTMPLITLKPSKTMPSWYILKCRIAPRVQNGAKSRFEMCFLRAMYQRFWV